MSWQKYNESLVRYEDLRFSLDLSLMDMNPNEVRELLLEFLEENVQKEEEPLSDKIAREWRIR